MKKLLGKPVIIAVVMLVLLGGAAAAATRLLAGPIQIKISTGAAAESATSPDAGHDSGLDSPDGSRKSGDGRARGEVPTLPYAMKERVVNLADKGGFRYLKIEVVLDVALPHAKPGDKLPRGEEIKKAQEEIALQLAPVKPRFEDAVTTTLTVKTSEELMTLEGKQRLRDELRERLDRLSPDLPIMGVYFTQFIIQ